MIYYVRQGGLDTHNGQSATAAFRTVGKALSVMVAGDIGYVGAGVYREALTITASGANGSPIVLRGDYSGALTGDAGDAILTAQTADGGDSDDLAGVPASTLTLDDVKFVELRDLTLGYGGEIAVAVAATAHCAEGVTFANCVFQGAIGSGQHDPALRVDYGAPTRNPVTTGFSLTGCVLHGRVDLIANDNEFADIDLRATLTNCIFVAAGQRGGGAIHIRRDFAGAYPAGGITVSNCTRLTGAGALVCLTAPASTVYAYRIYNNLDIAAEGPLLRVVDPVGSPRIEPDHNQVIQGLAGAGVRGYQAHGPLWLGGLSDFPLRRTLGLAAGRPWEPLPVAGEMAGGSFLLTTTPVTDLYGSPRLAGPSALLTHFNQAAGSGWAAPAQAVDADLTTSATTTGNHALVCSGVPDTTATDADLVSARLIVRAKAHAPATLAVSATTLGVAVLNTTVGLTGVTDLVLPLATPSGGWSKARLAALSVSLSRTVGSGTWEVFAVLVNVTLRRGVAMGAVYPRTRPEPETTVKQGATGLAFKLNGPGAYTRHRFLFPGDYTLSVKLRYDSAYLGGLPTLTVTNLSDGAVATDTMTVGANVWETLSVPVTLAANSTLRVAVTSYDTGRTGVLYIEDLT